MNLKELREAREQAKNDVKRYAELITDHVEGTTFTGKEILDMIRSRKDDALWEDDPYKIFAGMLMDIVEEREGLEAQ